MNLLYQLIHSTKRLANWIRGRKYYCPSTVKCRRMFLGSSYGGKCVHPSCLNADSIVYSFGVGQDVSFDLALIDKFGADVFAFDPTPRSVKWVRSQSLPAKFHFYQYGLADFDGSATFKVPANPSYVSYSIAADETEADQVSLPVLKLSSVLKKLGHDHVDLLKIDIEGAEYKVIPDVLASGIQVGQFLIEFHHDCKGYGAADTVKAVDRLLQAGYGIFYVDPYGADYSFIKTNS